MLAIIPGIRPGILNQQDYPVPESSNASHHRLADRCTGNRQTTFFPARST